jgi:hypothetical protein
MIPNIDPNSRGRKTPKRSRKPLVNLAIFEARFNTIELPFGWGRQVPALAASVPMPQPTELRI